MINLSNYEEYFLLYVDNELNKTQADEVEAFAEKHPELATELQMLRQAKLTPADTMIFNNKMALLKTTNNGISVTNYEEYFLLHTDNELTAEAMVETERFILQHPQLQEEFMLLQQTKLSPEIMECPGKQLLYKQDRRRSIPLYISRMAVAAVIAGIAIIVWVQFNDNNKQQMAANKQQSITVSHTLPPQQNKDITLLRKQRVQTIMIDSQKVQPSERQLKKAVISAKVNISFNKQNEQSKPVIINTDNLPAVQQPAPEPIAFTNTPVPAQQESAVLKPLEEVSDNDNNTSNVVYTSDENTAPHPAVYKELNTDNDEQTLYVSALQLNKAKVNGLFKKAAHLLGGKAKEQTLQQ